VVVVTHDPGVARRFDRVIVVRDGRLVDPEEVSELTAAFGPLGSDVQP
jgi:ABC-type lipoprotein export system ATPase subunit